MKRKWLLTYYFIFLSGCVDGIPNLKKPFSNIGSVGQNNNYIIDSVGSDVGLISECDPNTFKIELSFDNGISWGENEIKSGSDVDCSDGSFKIIINAQSSLKLINGIDKVSDVLVKALTGNGVKDVSIHSISYIYKPVISSIGLTSTTFTQGTSINGQVVLDAQVSLQDILFEKAQVSSSCAWINVQADTGVISGKSYNNDVGDCNLNIKVSRKSQSKYFSEKLYPLSVLNKAPIFTVIPSQVSYTINAEASKNKIIAAEAVQSDEEGYGGKYSLWSSENTKGVNNVKSPQCKVDIDTFNSTINSDNGEINFSHLNSELTEGYFCYLTVIFDDLRGKENSIIYSDLKIIMEKINVAPVAVGNTLSTNEDTAVSAPLPYSDIQTGGNEHLAKSCSVSNPSTGISSLGSCLCNQSGNCSVMMVPNSNFNGVVTFAYKITDYGDLVSNEGTVTITVNAINDAPIALNISGSIKNNEDLVLDTQYSDVDLVDKAESCSISNFNSGAGLASCTCDGTGVCKISYTPDQSFFGTLNFNYRVNDGESNSNLASVTINVDSTSSQLDQSSNSLRTYPLTFSGDGLEVSQNCNNSQLCTLQAVRANVGKSSGKWYWEVTYFYNGSDDNVGLGIATVDFPIESMIIGSDATGIGYRLSEGIVYVDNKNIFDTQFDYVRNSDTLGVAVDLDNGWLWIRNRSGEWVEGDPTIEPNGDDSTLGAIPVNQSQPIPTNTTIYPWMNLKADSGYRLRVNFGSSNFKFTPPTGFNKGWFN